MSLVVTQQQGQILLLQYIIGLKSVNTSLVASTTQGPVLHLYSNDFTVNNSAVISSINECTSSGYAPITLVSTNWTTVQSSGITTAVYSQQTFTFNTNAISYGYYMTDTLNNLWLAERFSGAPFSISSSGGNISISNRISLQ